MASNNQLQRTGLVDPRNWSGGSEEDKKDYGESTDS